MFDRVEQGGGSDKVRRNELGTVGHDWVEGILAVRTQRAPDYWLWKEDMIHELGFEFVRVTRILTLLWWLTPWPFL